MTKCLLTAFFTLCFSTALACGTLTPEIRALTDQAASSQGLDSRLLAALFWQESRYCHEGPGGRPGITTSRAGALGIGQLMPATAAGLGVNPHVLEENMLGAAKYLREQWDSFGDWQLALAAYNAGPNAVKRHGGIPPYAETQDYVVKVLGAYETLLADEAWEAEEGTTHLAQKTLELTSAAPVQQTQVLEVVAVPAVPEQEDVIQAEAPEAVVMASAVVMRRERSGGGNILKRP